MVLGQARTRRGGSGKIAAVVLCILALAFNLLGSLAYAEAWRAAPAADISICHAAEDAAPADPANPQPPAKCPLCTVVAAAFAAPLQSPPILVAPAAAVLASPLATGDDVAPPLPGATRPGPRAPPACS